MGEAQDLVQHGRIPFVYRINVNLDVQPTGSVELISRHRTELLPAGLEIQAGLE